VRHIALVAQLENRHRHSQLVEHSHSYRDEHTPVDPDLVASSVRSYDLPHCG